MTTTSGPTPPAPVAVSGAFGAHPASALPLGGGFLGPHLSTAKGSGKVLGTATDR